MDFTGLVRLNRTPQGILVLGDFKAGIQADCVRCLEPFIQQLHAEFNELYVFKGRGITESGLTLPEDATIDFTSLVWEYINLDIPIKALCRPDCKGLCVMCGVNLNEEVCEHQSYILEE